jgi:Chaperone of endosialidase
MKRTFLFFSLCAYSFFCIAQNVGIGITTPTENFHVVGNKSLFENNFVSIGAGAPVSAFTQFQVKKNVNTFVGMYIDAGATGQPFYGYALNGIAKAYTQFNGNNSTFEYYQSNGGTPDFLINGNTKAVFNTGFVGIGTSTPTTAFTGFAMKNNVNNFYGMYIDAGATGQPFYGYALNGIAKAYTQFNGSNSTFEYYQSNGGTPDFLINGNTKAVFNTGFVGIGTSTPTTAFTGFAMKNNVNTFYGMYIDAGLTGQPFYGYSLNGVAAAYHQLNGSNGQYEYYHSNPGVPDFQIGNTSAAFANANFLGIGTTTPTTGFTGLALKTTSNNFYGTYVDAGPTGEPFYGYALNGTAKAYLSFASSTNSLEYHQTSDATPDFFIDGNTKAVFNTGFVGIGTSTPTTGFTGFAMKSSANTFYGSYVDAGPTGVPFYGYALNGVATAYTTYNGTTNQFEYHHTTDVTPDFSVSNTKASFPIQTALTVGTSTPLNGFTGLTLKNNVNAFYGQYIDAGATGEPFYGYALNGVSKAYTAFNSTNNAFEYHQTSDATPDFFVNGNTKAVFNTAFVGIGTGTPTTGFTGFAMKSAANTYYGSYIDAGPTGIPFYGYALNGVATAYTTYNGTTSQFEYHHTTDATPDFAVSNTQVVFPIQNFLGLGTSTPTTGATGLAIKSSTTGFYGMYVDAGITGEPFYGYAQNGTAKAWTEINGNNGDNWELFYGATRISIQPAGNVGIGTSTPAQKLDVAGVIHASNLNGGATTLSTDAAGNIIRTPSDARLKNNISEITNALDKILQMHGVTYNFIDAKRFGDNRQMGFLAQELEKIVPEAVSSGGEYKSVNYQVLTALLAEAVKEQQKEIVDQKKENEELKKLIKTILQRVEALEAAGK